MDKATRVPWLLESMCHGSPFPSKLYIADFVDVLSVDLLAQLDRILNMRYARMAYRHSLSMKNNKR